MAAGAVEFELPAGSGAEFVMTAAPCGFFEPQARTGIDLITDSPRWEEFVDHFLRDSALERFVDGVVDPKGRSTNGAAAGATPLATFQHGQIVLHVIPIRCQQLKELALRQFETIPASKTIHCGHRSRRHWSCCEKKESFPELLSSPNFYLTVRPMGMPCWNRDRNSVGDDLEFSDRRLLAIGRIGWGRGLCCETFRLSWHRFEFTHANARRTGFRHSAIDRIFQNENAANS